MKRMLLLENGLILMQKENGEQVGFNSLGEFYRFCPINKYRVDFTGKNYIDYEPDRGIYIDNKANIKIMVLPKSFKKENKVMSYEKLLDDFDNIKERKKDLFYGISIEEAKELKISILKNNSTSIIYKKWPYHKQVNISIGIEKGKKIEMTKDIKDVIKVYQKAKKEILSLNNKDKIRNYKPKWPEI